MTNTKSRNTPLVSIGLPVYNGVEAISRTVHSVLAQNHDDLELVIADNASDDGTEELCRELAAGDRRIRYHRQPRNVGLLNNFVWLIENARGQYFKWIGDDDHLEPTYLTRCMQRFADDERLILVTAQQTFTGPDGIARTKEYPGNALGSDCPVDRFAEVLRLLNASHLLIDPLYAIVRRAPVAEIRRRNMLREDEVFAAKMALAGPWAHVPEILAHRRWEYRGMPAVARQLGVPAWQARVSTALQCRELLAHLRTVSLTGAQRRRAEAAVCGLYLRRYQRAAVRGGHKLAAVPGRRRAQQNCRALT